ncbi:hypothetical protein D9756_004140 [Leucocoprinus leucothites]|uniref:Uncharacterized protein n=1 Tax=Leucocoprinus leucothites TaxID=201217 RepID=A0A8H5D973_9AGAR|nr:hypothetical protein D9756_004140 [Leucoagaricus leucothites]
MATGANQYSDPFTDHPGHQGGINGHSNYGAGYTDADSVSYYSPSMITARTDGDLVSTHQSDYVQRRQSNSSYSAHSKSRSMDKGGAAVGGGAAGEAAEFYNSGPQNSNFLNAGAGAGGKDGSRLSQLTEGDEDDYGFSRKYANSSYGAGLDGDVKTKPYDPHDEALDASLMKNAAPGRAGYSDLGT